MTNMGPSAFVKSIPRLTLPTFRGSPQEWPRWIGLFKALVHDQPSLSDSERMAHLQNAVEGPAAQAIDGMLFNGNLYGEALRTLQERFGREEDIIQAHLRKIFATSPPALTDLSAMEKFYAVVHNTVTVLQNLGYSSDLSSSENLRRVVEKLPNELAREWGREVFRLRPARPTLETFSKWLQVQVSILSFSAVQSGAPERKRAAAPPREGAVRRTALATGAACEAEPEEPRSPPLCRVCGDKHKVADCPSFKAKTLEERMEVVYDEGLCFSCLRKGHWTRRCRSARKCGIRGCKLLHHQLLHRGSEHPKPDQGSSKEEDPSRESPTDTARHSQAEGSGHRPFVAASVKNGTETLLQIVSVRVHGRNGSKEVLALLDAGAQTSLCSEDVLKELGVTGKRHPLCIQNVETSGAQRYSEKVQLTLSALGAEAKKEHINIPEVWSVPSLNVTAGALTKSQLHDCQHLSDLDFPQYNGGQVKLLIGANVLEAVLQKEVRVGRPNQPAAVKTDLGWSLTGSVSAVAPSSMRHVMFLRRQTMKEEDELSAAVSKWWPTEYFGVKYCETTSRSKEDERTLAQLEENTKRVEGRYRTGLLCRENSRTFPNSKQQAVQRLQATERKPQKQSEVAAQHREMIEACIAEGHARKLTGQETPQPLSDDAEKVKPTILVSAANDTCQPGPGPSKYSRWLRYRRVAAWVRRFAHNAGAHISDESTRRSGPLSSGELKDAEVWILKQTQKNAYPETIRSDNGTNFVGSCRELRAELRAMEKDIAEKLSAFEVDWRFNPPAASHMGGVWERMVRSVKNTLKVVVGRQTLTDEVLVTVLAEVEHMINSRPLTHVSSEPSDPEALTPNHFLLSGASRHIAPGLSRDQDLSSRRRWKQAQAVAEHVWKRWTKEYLPTLIKRSKWRQEQRNLQVGDLVLMSEPNLSRGSWPLARISRVFPAADGRVRSAELQTASRKRYTRPVAKICFLEEEGN